MDDLRGVKSVGASILAKIGVLLEIYRMSFLPFVIIFLSLSGNLGVWGQFDETE